MLTTKHDGRDRLNATTLLSADNTTHMWLIVYSLSKCQERRKRERSSKGWNKPKKKKKKKKKKIKLVTSVSSSSLYGVENATGDYHET
ncbi:hypothetical protein M0802_004011 [Mischocyttarus mexicanus]|nr:hypothetical protein M0802_004011 [Mischocyttarus mexicanus]